MEYKREFAIRQREEQARQKMEEEIAAKKVLMDEKRRKEEAAQKEREKEAGAVYTRKQQAKKKKQMENEFRERCREANITKKRNDWLTKENEKINAMLDDCYTEQEEVNERQLEAKERKALMNREDMEKKVFYKHLQKEKNDRREAKEKERQEHRKESEINRIDELKRELDREVDQFIEHGGGHVPLKQALCGGLRPIPTVTQLLAAKRDMEEDLKDLKEVDLEERAKALGKPVFLYVKEIKYQHEQSRLRPPEPQIGDDQQKRMKNTMKDTAKSAATTTRGSSTGFKFGSLR